MTDSSSATAPEHEQRQPGSRQDDQEPKHRGEASEPEVHKKQSSNKLPDEKPSQAEGDRETVEEDLEQKNLDE